ncbi:hypothetical protein AB6A40_005509 [Gnathostoma spinigerum]|uniref:Transmembrane protein 33 n=1 Tax=Gnathostoma spinigerum TaxID=75299 RepID=A0ABD6EFM7_9BILA
MVEIREDTSETENVPTQNTGYTMSTIGVLEYIRINAVDTVLFIARLITVFCSLYYVLPFFHPAIQHSAYSKAFVAAAATNAFRLHQRIGAFRFSREFIFNLLLEDACHYLLYSLFFITTAPITIALLPVSLYALLHAANYFVKLCKATGHGQNALSINVEEMINQNTQTFLGVIAISEVFILPFSIFMIFAGKASIIFPFLYLRFLMFRYRSRRNDTTRIVINQICNSLEELASRPQCPEIFRKVLRTLSSVIYRLMMM